MAYVELLPVHRLCVFTVQVGALASLKSGDVNPHDGDLTFLGRVLGSLPLDIRLGKLIMFGHVFGVLDEMIVISKYNICSSCYVLLSPWFNACIVMPRM